MTAEQIQKVLVPRVPEGFTVLRERDWLWVVIPEECYYEDIQVLANLGFQLSHKGRQAEGMERPANLYHKCRFLPKELQPQQQSPARPTEEEDLLADLF